VENSQMHHENTTESGKMILGFKELVLLLLSNWLVILIMIIISSSLALTYAVTAPDVYRSNTLVSPTSVDSSKLSGLSGSLGGLASLAGVSLGSGGTNKTLIGIEVMQSRAFILSFIKKYGLEDEILASAYWDKESRKLVLDANIYDETISQWYSKKTGEKIDYPSLDFLYEQFLKMLDVSRNVETGLVLISFEHHSPLVARNILKRLVSELNQTIKVRDIEQADQSIIYLREQLKSNQISELRTGIFDLIQSQIETKMLANSRLEYLFSYIDPPFIPETKVKPMRAVICILGSFLGALLGILFVLIRYVFRS
jgi:uncharacterized protein involved in exopolysaccharide biosynthesis